MKLVHTFLALGIAAGFVASANTSEASSRNVFYWLGQYGADGDLSTSSLLSERDAIRAGKRLFRDLRRAGNDTNLVFAKASQAALAPTGNSTFDNAYIGTSLINRTSPDRIVAYANRFVPDWTPRLTNLAADAAVENTGEGSSAAYTGWKLRANNGVAISLRNTLVQGFRRGLNPPRSALTGPSYGAPSPQAFYEGAASTIAYNFLQGVFDADGTPTSSFNSAVNLEDIVFRSTRQLTRGRIQRFGGDNVIGGAVVAFSAQTAGFTEGAGFGNLPTSLNTFLTAVISGATRSLGNGSRFTAPANNIAGAVYYAYTSINKSQGDLLNATQIMAIKSEITNAVSAGLKRRVQSEFNPNNVYDAVDNFITALDSSSPDALYGSGVLNENFDNANPNPSAPVDPTAPLFYFNGTQNEVTTITNF